MSDDCEQINIPTVDNTSEECSECGFFSTRCIVLPESIPYLGVLKDSTLKLLVDKIVKDLKKKGIKITEIQNSKHSAAHSFMLGNVVETVIAVQGTYYKAGGVTEAGEVVDGFTLDDNKLTYDESTTGYYDITAVLNITGTAGDLVKVRIAKNGVTQEASQAQLTINAAGKIENLVCRTIMELAKDDYIEVFITNSSSTNILLVTDLSTTVEKIN